MKKEMFISVALSYVDFPARKYSGKNNGCDISGFDCSGFVNFLLKQAKYPDTVPRHTNELFDVFGILIHEQFREAGDLVFFSSKGVCPDHVGIMVSHEEYVHSSGKSGKTICVRKLERKMIKSRNKVQQIYSFNPIGFKRMTINNGRYQRTFLE